MIILFVYEYFLKHSILNTRIVNNMFENDKRIIFNGRIENGEKNPMNNKLYVMMYVKHVV